MTSITSTTAKHGWMELLSAIQRDGRVYTDQDGRECKELLNVLLSISAPTDALDIVREMQRQPTWVYPSPEELKSIILGSTLQGAHEYSYVPRIFGKVNQIDGFIIPLLKASPQSRRAVVMLYQPDTDSKLASKNVPGLISIQFRVLGALEVTCHIRSNDVFIGFPANIFQMRCLQEYVAQRLGIEAGAMHLFSGSAHVFTEYSEQLQHVTKTLRARTAR
jgi:thymidylate synthase